jgi:hypothetical protein
LTTIIAFRDRAEPQRHVEDIALKSEGKPPFDPMPFPASVGPGKTKAELSKGQRVFSQGDPADAVFYRAIAEFW